jgi:hypothetical protein
MTHDERSRKRVAGDRELFAIRRAERKMAADEHDLARGLDAFKQDLEHAEHTIEAELRAEHSGHDPERPVSWRAGSPDG